ncbi:cytochrome P450 [Cadophora sp. DSE1049]|nr:cytochrome P450 [Cadophora sp. DSE1049]
MPAEHSWLQFNAWAVLYGPIFRLKLGSREHVVISSEAIANELLRERGNIYSSREQLPMAAALVSDNLRPLMLPYNDRWRRGRKLMHRIAMPVVAATYEPAQSHESKRLVYHLLRDPAGYDKHFQLYSGGLIFRIGYGKRLLSSDEPYLRRIVAVNHNLERIASPGAYLVDTVPVLKYLPTWIAPFKKEAARLHAEELELFRQLLSDVRTEAQQGRSNPCFALTFINEQDKFELSDDEGAYVVGTMFEAGSGTTAAAMVSLCQIMTLYPEWQKPMWEEVDRVCGDRMPEFADLPKLPTVRATIKEVLRWRPVTAGGVPHQLTRDDVYNGYFLPAGAIVHANQWAIHRDPTLYPDPEQFNPTRWLLPEYPTYKEPLSKYPNLQNFSAFGFGRRICPGMNIAERSLYILTARIAWACRISKTRDLEGREIAVPLYAYTGGFNTQPKPWAFELMARSEEREKAAVVAWEETMKNDPLRQT